MGAVVRILTDEQRSTRREQRRLYDMTPEAKALKRAAARRHYEAHRDEVKRATKEYAIAHPNETREYKRGYRAANRDYLQAHRKKRKKERQSIFDAIKLESGCVDCGYRENARALDFDHREASQKRADVSQMVFVNIEVALAEIAKCDVRCANCHRIKTKERGHGG